MRLIALKLVCLIASVTFLNPTFVGAEGLNSLEDERKKQLQELGVLLPEPDAIIADAEEEFAKPIQDQSKTRLEDISKRANSYANLISKIADEYDDYLRSNSRYDFVVEEVQNASVVEELMKADSVFKTIRNRAYLNLGRIALAEKEEMKAFLLFNDAFRLSAFSCGDGKDNCVRYEAEQYMKELLGVQGESYVHLKK